MRPRWSSLRWSTMRTAWWNRSRCRNAAACGKKEGARECAGGQCTGLCPPRLARRAIRRAPVYAATPKESSSLLS